MSFTPIPNTKFVSTEIGGNKVFLLIVTQYEINFGLNKSQSNIGLVVCNDGQGNFKIYKNNKITLELLNGDITDTERDSHVKSANEYYNRDVEINIERRELAEKKNKYQNLFDMNLVKNSSPPRDL